MTIAPSAGSSAQPGLQRTFVPLVCIGTVALVSILAPRVPAPRLEVLGPVIYAIATLCELATAAVLFSMWRFATGRRATLVLALTFAVGSVLMLLTFLTVQLEPNTPAIVPSYPRSGPWLFVGGHIAVGAGALCYIVLRRRVQRGDAPSRVFSIVATAIAVAVAVAIAAPALLLADKLPGLVEQSSFEHLMVTGVGPATIVALLVVAILALRVRRLGLIVSAVAFTLIALAVDLAILALGPPLFSTGFYAGRLLLLLGSSFVLFAAVQTLVQARSRLHGTEGVLSRVQSESASRAGRIRALWQITQDQALSQQEQFNAVLATATAAIRPGKPMFGCLTHLDGDNVVVDSTSWIAHEPTGELTDRVSSGTVYPLKNTLQSSIYADGGTKAWNDLSLVGGEAGKACAAMGWRSLIGTSVAIGRRTHFLTLASTETMLDDPFAEDDVAYIEVVAAFFASRFSQQIQFERIQFQIEHDALTGLENRVQFRKAIREAIAAGNPFAVAFVDLTGFRHINEQHGHQIGDEVLVEVAAGLKAIDGYDFVARMAGDEFGVIVRGGVNEEETRRSLGRYAQRFVEPFHTGDREGTQTLRIGASIGAARFPNNGKTAEDLMLRADAALVAAKAHGGSTISIFDAHMETLMSALQVRVGELAEAIAGDQLVLAYQPTFDLATRKVVGAEALIRWDHPSRGRLFPADFIAFAERNELITPLSRWVLARLVRDVTSGPVLPKGFRVYFNLNAQTLADIPFIAELKATLRKASGLVEHLGVELTESAAMSDVESAVHTIELFRRWGLFVAIDDFGTGYSSLSYLKKLVVDVVKIDRSFVMGLPEDERDAAITDMLLRITDRFGFNTLAEGIETEAQAAWLLEHGCRVGQGYYFAKACSYKELLKQLAPPLVAA